MERGKSVSGSELSKVLEEGSHIWFARSQELTQIWEPDNWMKNNARLFRTLWMTQLEVEFQCGFWTDREISRTEILLSCVPILWIPKWEKISKEWRKSNVIKDLDIIGDSRLEDSTLSPPEEEEELWELLEKSDSYYSNQSLYNT